MRSLRRAVWAISAVLVPLVAAGPASAAKQTLVQYPVSIDVSMRVTVTEQFESIQKCTPGENGSVTYTYDFESDRAGTKGKVGNAKVSLLNGEGGSGWSMGEAGGAVERGKAGSWEFSLDDCVDGDDVKLPEGVSSPQCKTLKGRVKAAILIDPASGDDELAPLDGPGKLSLTRSGGGAQNRSCVRLIQNVKQVDDTDFDLSMGLSTFDQAAKAGQGDTFTIALPNLRSSLMKISGGGGTRFAHRFNVSGPCYAITGKTNKAQRSLFDDSTGNIGPVFGIPRFETCSVQGQGVVIVTRRGRVTKQSF
ncbi:MAG: hypothetical protein PGN13_03455 [Patulibacter minatonensis]